MACNLFAAIMSAALISCAWGFVRHGPHGIDCDDRVKYYATSYAQSFVANNTLSTVYEVEDSGLAFWPTGVSATRGILFFGEACVDPVAYAPLISSVNAGGYLGVLVYPSGDDPDDYNRAYGKATGILDFFGTTIQKWAVGGHGGGGELASRLTRALYPRVTGLYLLAAYPTVDVSKLTIVVASIYGTKDSVTSVAAIQNTTNLLPDNTYYQAINGASHSDFGFYSGGKDPLSGDTNNTAVLSILTAPMSTVVTPNVPSIIRLTINGLQIYPLMPESTPYLTNTTKSRYEYSKGRYHAWIPNIPYNLGLVYSMGSFVDPRAYAPWAQVLADRGILVVIPATPMSTPLIDLRENDKAFGYFPNVTKWVTGGHSIGAVAASYAAYVNPAYVGLLLHDSGPRHSMGNYTKPIMYLYSATQGTGPLPTTSAAYTSYYLTGKLPKHTQYYPVQGGNHYQFGWYGFQEGFTLATISREEETRIIAEISFSFLMQFYYI